MHLQNTNHTPIFLLKQCKPPSLDGLTIYGWSRFGVYNNFFITKVSFWVTDEVLSMLQTIDLEKGIYTKRWNDNLVHTAITQSYLAEEQVYKFHDFTYEHATLSKDDNKLLWGGMYIGIDDEEGDERANRFRAEYGDLYRCTDDKR